MKSTYAMKQGVAHNGEVEIAYEMTSPLDAGTGLPAFLFLAGWGETVHSWRQQVTFFSPRFPTLTYDRRGLGRSSHLEQQEAYTVEQELADVESLLMETGFAERPLYLVGHSSGCHLLIHWLAQRKAKYGMQVKQAILIAPTSRVVRDAEAPFGYCSEQEVQQMYTALLQGDNSHLLRYARRGIPEGGAVTEPLRQAVAHVVPTVMSSRIAVWTFDLYFRQDLRPLLSKIEIPVLVISGEQDPTMPPEAGADVAAHLQHARQVIIPQVGHLLHITTAVVVNRLIEEFLR